MLDTITSKFAYATINECSEDGDISKMAASVSKLKPDELLK